MTLAVMQVQEGRQSLCLFLEEGHPGVHGIAASRIKDAFGRPTIIFSPKQGHADIITGSGRSIEEVHLRQALEWIAHTDPGVMESFGGHRGAAGVTIRRTALATFNALLEQAVYQQLGVRALYPIIWTDGALPTGYLAADFVDQLEQTLAPFGREFEAPVFEMLAIIESIQPVGDGTHAKLRCIVENYFPVEAIWFGARAHAEDPFSVAPGDTASIAFSPKNNLYRGKTMFNPHIIYCQKHNI